MVKILVVDDEPDLEALIKQKFRKKIREREYEYIFAVNGKHGLEQLDIHPDVELVLSDINMPEMDGPELVKKVREMDSCKDTKIVMVSTESSQEFIDNLLAEGADDYITKPFSPKELVARIKAVMRRISPMAVEEVIEMQGLSLDPTSHRVMAGEEPLEMGPTEFKLLHFFMTHPERVYSREQLLNHVWGTNVYVEDRTVDVHIRRLRKALEPGGHDRMVQTVRGTGYRFSTRF